MDDNIESTQHEGNVHINIGIPPIYADDIVQFNFERGVAKILLAQRFQQELTHTHTVALPLETILTLKYLLNTEEFTKAAQDAMERR